MQSLIKHFKFIIEHLAQAEDSYERLRHENNLVATTFSIMLIMGAITAYIAGIQWKIDFFLLNLFFCCLLIGSFFCYLLPKLKLEESLKTHIIGWVAVIIIALTFWMFYERVYVLFWYLPLLIILCSTFVVSNNRVYYYITTETVVLFLIAHLLYPVDIIHVDASYLTILTVFLGIYFFLVHISKTIQGATNRKKIEFLKREIEQNQEITLLYEETIAADENIKEQNKELNAVNRKLEDTLNQLEQYAYYDSLTGLPNRRKIYDEIEALIKNADENTSFNVIFVDIDDFKKINDTLGHSMGDQLLIEIAKRISSKKQSEDLFGRLGGDEFALIINRKLDQYDLSNYLTGLCRILQDTMVFGQGIRVDFSASLGVSTFPTHGDNRESILRAADTAMYKAKEKGKSRFEIYCHDMYEEIIQKMNLESRMVQALYNEEFYMVYQPIFHCKTGRLYGFEALIRWETKDKRTILPKEFIPLAEKTGFIIDMGTWIMRKVCHEAQRIIQLYQKDLKFSINISPIQISKDDFIDRILNIMKEFDLPDRSIQIEITESVFIENREEAVEKLNILRSNGMTISLDDFGTGYSSLSYLIDLPLDSIKIDKSFVDLIGCGDSRDRLINAVIGISFSMRTDVIAEGVETPSQLEYLRNRNCDYVQGYLLGHPMDAKQMDEFLSGFLISQE